MTQDPIAALGGVEFSESNRARSVTMPTDDIVPGNPCVILKTKPYAPGNHIKIPAFIVEALRIYGDPDFPQSQTSQERLDGGKSAKSPWESLSENAMLPIKVEMDQGVSGASLDNMDKC